MIRDRLTSSSWAKMAQRTAVSVLLALSVTVSAPASSEWQANRHYKVLSMPPLEAGAGGKVQVIEFFTFGCGHCYDLEPALREWQQHAAPYIELRRVPVIFGKPEWRAYARLHYTLQALGRAELRAAVFAAIYTTGQELAGGLASGDEEDTLKRLRAFAEAHGIRGEAFVRVYRSGAIDAEVRAADALARYYKISSVPALLIAGKYLSKVEWAGGAQALCTLIDALSAREHAAAASASAPATAATSASTPAPVSASAAPAGIARP